MRSFLRDIRVWGRSVTRRPGPAIVIIVTLAVGIGATSAISSVVYSVLLTPLPFASPDRIVGIRETLPDEGEIPVAYRTFAACRDANTVFESVAAQSVWNFNLEDENPLRVSGMRVTPSYFDVMGVKPLRGRTFSATDSRLDAEKVAILAFDLWRSRFGSSDNVIGQSIRLDGVNYTVVGVMPPVENLPQIGWASLWVPLAVDETKALTNPFRYLSVEARLKPGASVQQARAELERIINLLRRDFPDTHGKPYGISVAPVVDYVVPKRTRLALLIMFGFVICVLLIACTNVVNLMLARAISRQPEMAVRMALGASRLRLVRHSLAESLMLSLIGTGCGLAVAAFGVELLLRIKPDAVPRAESINLNWQILGFALACAFIGALVFAVVPTVMASNLDLGPRLKDGGSRYIGMTPRQRRLKALLVVVEVAVAVSLLIGSGLMMRTYLHLRSVNPGFNYDSLLTFEINLPSKRYAEANQRVSFYRDLVQRVQVLPGVERVAATQAIPLRGPTYSDPVFIDGQPLPSPGEEPFVRQNIVSPEYFDVFGITIVQGRPFTEQECWEKGGVVIVNESFVKKFFPGSDPIGRRIKLGRDKPWLTVVGVSRNVMEDGLGNKTFEEMFYPYINPSDPLPVTVMSLAVRTKTAPQSVLAPVQNEVHRLDPGLPISKVMTGQELVEKALAGPRFNVYLFGLFAVVALLLAVVGIYGVISHSVGERVKEIGVRLALGAQRRDVMRLVLKEGMWLTLSGVFLGLLLSVALSRGLASLLYGVVGANDPLTFVVIPSLIIGAGLLACYVPARRASNIDPAEILRID